MSLNFTQEKLLERAKEQEKKHGWLYAAWSYEQALSLAVETASFAAETWQLIGFCYERASRQAENIEEFTKLRQHAVEAYQKAAILFEKMNNGTSAGKALNATPSPNTPILGLHPLLQKKRRYSINAANLETRRYRSFKP
jgi:hypothetical protein